MYREPADDEAATYAKADAAEISAFQAKMGEIRRRQRLRVFVGLALGALVLTAFAFAVARHAADDNVAHRDCHIVTQMDVDNVGGHVTRHELLVCGDSGAAAPR